MRSTRVVLYSLLSLGTLNGAQAQCANWSLGFEQPGIDQSGVVEAMVVYDDGSGAALYVAGDFTRVDGNTVNGIARWDGSSWSSVGGGLTSTGGQAPVRALVVHDDGSGPALYAGGVFTIAGGAPAAHLARWDGTTWSDVGGGVDGPVTALGTYDSGSGSELYVGGQFFSAGGNPVFRLAKWDGTTWSDVGGGLNGETESFTVFDDGTGDALFLGGTFTVTGGGSSKYFAKWDGANWTTFNTQSNGEFLSLLAHDGGSGAALYVAGSFTQLGGQNIARLARWNGGNSWSPVGGGVSGSGAVSIESLSSIDFGSGNRLCVAGKFSSAGATPANNIAVFDGGVWSSLSSGTSDRINVITAFDDGSALKLLAGGTFNEIGGTTCRGVGAWNGSQWESCGSGHGLPNQVNALLAFHPPWGPPALFAGGSFSTGPGTLGMRAIGSFDGSAWSPLDVGIEGIVYALTSCDDGNGLALFAGGTFATASGVSAHNVARWDGTSWSALGSGTNNLVRKLFGLDDGTGPALYALGEFSMAGSASVPGIARWDGSTWSAVPGSSNFLVTSVAAFDDGSGVALYGAGTFLLPVTAAHVAKLTGGVWTAVGAAFDQAPTALTVMDDGSGPALYAAGNFLNGGGSGAAGIARWDDPNWAPLDTGLAGSPQPIVSSMSVYDDGSGGGQVLYVFGKFTTAGGQTVRNVASWDGSSWSDAAGGANIEVRTGTVLDTGSGGALYIGGAFTEAGSTPSRYIARWENTCQVTVGEIYCSGDGSGTACPCGNESQPGSGEGCLNSTGSGGLLTSAGVASIAADSLVLRGSGMPDSIALFFQGTAQVNGGNGSVFADGLRCAGGSLLRLGAKPIVGGESRYPGEGDDPISLRGQVPTWSGVTRFYQAWYRNPAPTFCTAGTTNYSNGLATFWAP